MSRFSAVIFDCDGVLVDSEPISARSLVRCLRNFAFAIDVDYVYEHYLGRSYPTIVQDYAARTGVPLPEAFLAHWQDDLFRAFRDELRPITGIEAVLERLTLPRAVVSSSLPERLSLCLQVTGLDRFFADCVFSVAMVARGKPAPDLFLLGAARLGGDPARMLAVEDSASGVAAARAAGMTAWGFTGGGHFAADRSGRHLLAAGAEQIFDDMRELLALE